MLYKILLLLPAASLLFWSCAENPIGADMPNEVTIEILSSQFRPGTVTIEPGTRVVWINRDTDTHAVDPGTLMEPTSDFDGSPNLEQNETFSVTFINAGTIKYYCSIHQVNLKQGTIIVQP